MLGRLLVKGDSALVKYHLGLKKGAYARVNRVQRWAVWGLRGRALAIWGSLSAAWKGVLLYQICVLNTRVVSNSFGFIFVFAFCFESGSLYSLNCPRTLIDESDLQLIEICLALPPKYLSQPGPCVASLQNQSSKCQNFIHCRDSVFLSWFHEIFNSWFWKNTLSFNSHIKCPASSLLKSTVNVPEIFKNLKV